MIAALTALLIAVGLAACGGSGDTDSTATRGASTEQGAFGESGKNKASNRGSSNESTSKSHVEEERSGSSGSKGSENQKTSSPGSQSEKSTPSSSEGKSGEARSGGQAKERRQAKEFVPKHHHDSDGGSGQFIVKGGDNSVQEYGEEASPSEFEAAATALHNFLDARAESNWAAVCAYISKGTITSIEHLARGAKPGTDTSCAAILAGVISQAAKPELKAEAENADVRSLRVEGENAFVIYTNKSVIVAMPILKEDGGWKVSSLGGTPLN
ncbi:MAG: hypothetical protein WBM00_01545 [Solirubrobacterales bacterium]